MDDCNDGDRGPVGGFSVAILALVVMFLVGLIGFHAARNIAGRLRSRRTGSGSALGTYFSPVLPMLFFLVYWTSSRPKLWTVSASQASRCC